MTSIHYMNSSCINTNWSQFFLLQSLWSIDFPRVFCNPWDSQTLVFSSVILGILRFSSSHSVFMNMRARLRGPFPTLLCLTTTGHLGRIFLLFFLFLLIFLCDYLWSFFFWLVPVFSSVILGILRFSSSHSMFMNIRDPAHAAVSTLFCLTTTGHLC